MLVLTVLCLLPALALGFAAAASRVVTRAERATCDTAARHRFLSAFDARGAGPGRVPSDLLVQTFEVMGARATAPGATLRPAARLRADLGLSAVDIEDAALLVTARCEADHLPHGHDLDALAREVTTVEEFVHFLTPFVERAPTVRAA